MAVVEIARAAQRDLMSAVRHLANFGGRQPALEFVQQIEQLKQRLAIHPLAYATRPQLGEHVRVAVIGSYLVLYQHHPRSDRVTMLRVLHGRRDIGKDYASLS